MVKFLSFAKTIHMILRQADNVLFQFFQFFLRCIVNEGASGIGGGCRERPSWRSIAVFWYKAVIEHVEIDYRYEVVRNILSADDNFD